MNTPEDNCTCNQQHECDNCQEWDAWERWECKQWNGEK